MSMTDFRASAHDPFGPVVGGAVGGWVGGPVSTVFGTLTSTLIVCEFSCSGWSESCIASFRKSMKERWALRYRSRRAICSALGIVLRILLVMLLAAGVRLALLVRMGVGRANIKTAMLDFPPPRTVATARTFPLVRVDPVNPLTILTL